MPKMRKNLMLLAVSLIIGVSLVSGCASNEPQAQATTGTQIIESITVLEASALIQANEGNLDFVILDVRTPEEFTSGYIEGAILVDYYSETYRDELNYLDKNKVYLIYCRSGNRSGKTLPIMEELGFQEVYNMLGGINDWKEEGLPVAEYKDGNTEYSNTLPAWMNDPCIGRTAIK